MRARMVVALLALLALALQAQPATITIPDGPGAPVEHVFTLINDEPRPLSVVLEEDPYSAYLSEHLTISEERFVLRPQESKNIQIRGTIPRLGPETHDYALHATAGGERLATLHLLMPIAGTPLVRPKVSVTTDDVVESEAIVAETTLYNFGNINLYYNLSLRVRSDEETLGEVRYPRLVQVLPGSEEQLSLLYTDRLDPGTYTVTVGGSANGEAVSDTKPLRVVLADQDLSVTQGDDLVLTIDNAEARPRIEYAVVRGAQTVLQDSITSQEEALTIPTATLPPGEYDVTVRTTHAQGTDVTRIALTINAPTSVPVGSLWLLAGLLVMAAAYAPPTRLRLRILYLSARIGRRERQLKRLLARAHRYAHEPL